MATENTWRIQYWGGDSDFTLDTANKWVHFTHVHDGVNTKVYANGLLIVDYNPVIDTGTVMSFRIGAYGDGDGNIATGFDGLIDDMRLYDNALTHMDVAVLYKAVMPDVPICVDEANPAMDLDGDCRVGVEDLALFVSDWMECNLVPDCKP